jgi:hypothetical protein
LVESTGITDDDERTALQSKAAFLEFSDAIVLPGINGKFIDTEEAPPV